MTQAPQTDIPQTDTSRVFTLRLADAKDFPAPVLRGLETRVETGPGFHDAYDLIDEAIGPVVPQGSLLAYLLRRFGFPNRPSDPYKELAAYLLTTSHPGMLMGITPYAGGDSSLSFTFLIEDKKVDELRRWPLRARHAHDNAFPDWLEKNDLLPDWMDDARKEAAKNRYCAPNKLLADIPEVLRMISMFAWKAEREGKTDERVEWHKKMRERYEAEYPMPAVETRGEDWQDWPEGDPLKPYARAIMETLTELTRPVWVRDVPIDPWGQMKDDDAAGRIEALGGDPEEDESTLTAEVAGHGVGWLANHDPQGHADLMNLVHALGEGDTKAGFAKANALLTAAQGAEAHHDFGPRNAGTQEN